MRGGRLPGGYLLSGPGEGQTDLRGRVNAEAHGDAGAGEDRFGLRERFAERLEGEGAVRGAERTDRQAEFGVGGVDVCRGTPRQFTEVAMYGSIRSAMKAVTARGV